MSHMHEPLFIYNELSKTIQSVHLALGDEQSGFSEDTAMIGSVFTVFISLFFQAVYPLIRVFWVRPLARFPASLSLCNINL